VPTAELWIGNVNKTTDDKGKDLVRYELERKDGKSLGTFVTPITSRLARVLLEETGLDLGRERR
jgi:hypothetical protein